MKNRALIYAYCEVIAENSKGIYFKEDGCPYGIVELEDGSSYSCNSLEEFEMLTE